MKLRILFVDDDQNVLDGFRSMLHPMRKKLSCTFCTSAQKALHRVEQDSFDMVIADMRLPGLGGACLLKEVEKLHPGIIRIVLSGYSDPQALLKSATYAHQFLSKPCDTATIINTIRRMANLRHILTNESVRTIATKLDALPAMPELFLKIKQELEKKNPDLKLVANLVQEDIGLSATVMKVVNSSFFGFFDKVAAPSRAVILLGVDILKGLVMGEHFFRQIGNVDQAWYSVGKLWGHSLQTGAFAKVIAGMESKDGDFVDNCFIAGLLHDVGKLIFLTQMRKEYEAIIKAVKRMGGPVVDREQEALDVTHSEIGAYLLGLWGFSEPVVSGVWGHHAPKPCPNGINTALVVHVANFLQHELAPQQKGYTFAPLLMECLEAKGLQDRMDPWKEECMTILEEGHER